MFLQALIMIKDFSRDNCLSFESYGHY